MKKNAKRYLLLMFALYTGIITGAANIGEANQNADSAFRFLSIGEGARPAGMGEAFTALADDVNAVYWNPAGLSGVHSHEITTSYLQYLVDINIGYAAYALPAGNGGLGIGVTYVDYGAIKELTYEEPSGTLGDYRPYDLMLTAGYGQEFSDRLSAGLSLKGIYEEIRGYTAHAVAADAGLLYRPPVKHLTLGLAVQNLGVQTKAFVDEMHSLPVTYKIGAGYGVLDDSLKLALDYYRMGSDASGINSGIEYVFKHMILLRCGYQTRGQDLKTGSSADSVTGFCAGLGIRYGCLNIDYAFIPYNELGQTQRISLGFRFDNRPKNTLNKQQVISRSEPRRDLPVKPALLPSNTRKPSVKRK